MTDIQSQLAAYRARKAAERNKAPPSSSGAPSSTLDGRHEADYSRMHQQPMADGDDPPATRRRLTPWQRLALQCLVWLALFGAFVYAQFGVPFLILSLFYVMWASLRGSRRRPGEPSAYSVFNEGCEAIDGTLKAEQFDRELTFRT